MDEKQRPVLLYDGQCGLCHGVVRTILRLEYRHELLFAPQQSELGRGMLASHRLPPEPGTVVLICGERAFFRSEAALGTFGLMGGFWPIVAFFGRLIPRRLRDWAYDFLSRNRHRFFGTHSDACSLPRPEQRDRFLV